MSARLEKLVKATEGLGTLVLVGLGVLFAIGTLVVNIHLGTLGLSDFSGLRPRFVLVGLAFLLYLAIPPACCIAVLHAGATVGFRRRPVLAVLTSLVVALVLMVVIPNMLFFAVPSIDQEAARIVSFSFWGLYLDSTYSLVVQLGLIALPAGILSLHSRHSAVVLDVAGRGRLPRRIRRHVPRVLMGMIGLGATGMLYPYATINYMSISRAVGGGHPSIVLMTMERDVGRLLDRANFSRVTQVGDTVYGPFLVWHESEDRTYLSLAEEGTRPSWEVYGVANEKIRTKWYLHGSMYLESPEIRTLNIRIRFDWPVNGAGAAPD